MKKILKGPALIYCLVRKIKEKNPDKQIGKTIIQKLMYIFEINSNKDFDYTMYHYGPHSSKVEDYINIAEALEMLKIEWIPDKGYSINPLNKSSNLLIKIEKEEKRKIEKIVEKFGEFNVNELLIITTALYIKNNFETSESSQIIDTILLLKPQYQRNQLKQLLEKANILTDSIN